MSRTKRKKAPSISFSKGAKEVVEGGKGIVRDGSPTHYSGSCERHGGCPFCEGNRLHSSRKRQMIEEDWNDCSDHDLQDGEQTP